MGENTKLIVMGSNVSAQCSAYPDRVGILVGFISILKCTREVECWLKATHLKNLVGSESYFHYVQSEG